MNNLNKYILYILVLLMSFSLTGCIKEVEPMSDITTQKQTKSDPNTAKNFLYGIPAYENTVWHEELGVHCSFGLAAWMIIRDTETGDVARPGVGYNWFVPYSHVIVMDKNSMYSQLRWGIIWKFIQTTNELLGSLPDNPEEGTDTQKGYYAVGKAFRAMIYLDAAQCYWFAPCKTDNKPYIDNGNNEEGNNITNLTLPVITENTEKESASENPRLSKDDMIKFIEDDLEDAEKYIGFFKEKNKIFPDKASIYGLSARLNLWKGDYEKAEKYAGKAIETYLTGGGSVMTKEQYLDKRNGNNNLEYYMWGSQQTSGSRTVTSKLLNWTSWMYPEALYGYAKNVPPRIDKKMYERINDRDWRKWVFKPAEGSGLSEIFKRLMIEPGFYDKIPAYSSIKFRPKDGDIDNPTVSPVVAYPIMRVEEMFFIEAEALAQQDKLAEAKSKLEEFMKGYRYKEYSTGNVNDKKSIIDEIIFQKRVELWGEGRTYFDIKRLDMSIKRGYAGTPHADGACYNTEGRPAWMNWVIVGTEETRNKGVNEWNNPDPTGAINLWIGDR